jgi:RNA polymerase sigma factor (sigma-70 family)
VSPRLSDLLLRSQSDERLVSLARAGQDRAFAAIVQRYRPELLALARQLTYDGHAEDVVQQAFLSAFAALRSGADVRHLRGWLYQIVRNAATKARPRGDLALEQVEIAGEPLEDTVLRRVRALAAMSEVALLPERQRGALIATALGEHAHADVALSMGISEQAVRQLVHRARTYEGRLRESRLGRWRDGSRRPRAPRAGRISRSAPGPSRAPVWW